MQMEQPYVNSLRMGRGVKCISYGGMSNPRRGWVENVCCNERRLSRNDASMVAEPAEGAALRDLVAMFAERDVGLV